MSVAGRVLPHSQEAEESVIGGVLLHPRTYPAIAAILSPDDFYHPALRAIYEAFAELARDSKPIDALTVVEQMAAMETIGKLRAFGDADYLTELAARVVTVENLEYHARIVRGRSGSRRLVAACSEIAARGYGGAYGDDEEFIMAAGSQIAELVARGQHRAGPRHIKKVMGDFVHVLAKRHEHRGAIIGIPLGLTKLDRLICGMEPGDLILIAARPSMGKSALAGGAIVSAAMAGHPTLVFSLEMSGVSVVARLVSADARIDGQKIRTGLLTVRDWGVLPRSTERLASLPVWLDDSGAQTIESVIAVASSWYLQLPEAVRAKGGLIVVDYLQLLEAAMKREENRQAQVAAVSRGLKSLAKALNVPVLALSQLNRGVDGRDDKRPRLSDIRESGAIEQDADVIIFVYRDEVYSKDQCLPEDKGVAELIVGKQRNGPTDTVRVRFLGEYTQFAELAEEERYPDAPPPRRSRDDGLSHGEHPYAPRSERVPGEDDE